MANKSLFALSSVLLVTIIVSFIFLTIWSKIPPNKPSRLTKVQNIAFNPVTRQYMTWDNTSRSDYSRQRIPLPGDYTYVQQ